MLYDENQMRQSSAKIVRLRLRLLVRACLARATEIPTRGKVRPNSRITTTRNRPSLNRYS